MTHDQLNLLLIVANVLRDKISNEIYGERESHLWALDAALDPFKLTGPIRE